MASGEMSEVGKKKSSGIEGLLFYMVPVVAVAAMLIFGGLFLRDYMEYKAAGDEYADLAEDYIRGGDVDEANAVAGNADGAAGESVGVKSLPYPSLQINYDALLNTNADFACVLYIPVLELKYPVVYSSDNTDYLHKTFDGKQNFAGTIFYDCLSPHDFRAKNTFFFGHNMKNGSMFGTLKKLEKEPGLCASNPYIYVYTKGHVRKYRIFSFYETTDGSAAYDDFVTIVEEVVLAEEALEQDADDILPIIQVYAGNLALAAAHGGSVEGVPGLEVASHDFSELAVDVCELHVTSSCQ